MQEQAGREVRLIRRTRPDQLRYLAAKLRDGCTLRESVALALEALAGELAKEEEEAMQEVEEHWDTVHSPEAEAVAQLAEEIAEEE